MNDDQLLRYSRQIMLPEVDVAGQEKLLGAHVAIVGLGGLGSPAALYLAAAGIGALTLVDFDTVDVSNLQRQVVHRHDAVGQPKVDSARATLEALNPDLIVNTVPQLLDDAGLRSLAARVDVVLDGTDNYAVRYQLNDACLAARTPLVSAAAIRFEAQLTTFDSRREDSPCYRCLYPEAGGADQTCSENGVIAPLVGIVGAFEALEVIKLITGVGETLVGRVLYFDAKYAEWREFKLARLPGCPACSGA
ncbi:MAG: molybdopterin-synthase adenylyltransferase MoeB [Pseudomonadales bacterium]|nr:molybdopterin-synthase adenylyltransferase MoeB [Pseudomonadales bacterium]